MVSEIKERKDIDSKVNKNVFFILGFAVTLSVVVLVIIVFSMKNNEALKYGTPDSIEGSIVYKEGLTFSPTKEDKNNRKEKEETQLADTEQNNQVHTPEHNNPTTSVSSLPDVSGWDTAQIVSKAKAAVNKTKAFTGNLTVNHSEGFTADVTECTGGEIVKSVVNLMIGWVVKPVNETLVYQNGKTVNSEGETVPIILPKRNGFSLSEKGVESATIQQTGNEYIIKITLVEESVGMYDVPTHNAAAVGYLDVAGFDISFMDIDSADIVYKGSSIELRINAEGFVTYANYKIPLRIDGSAHKGSISGSATFEGEQTEEWRLNW